MAMPHYEQVSQKSGENSLIFFISHTIYLLIDFPMVQLLSLLDKNSFEHAQCSKVQSNFCLFHMDFSFLSKCTNVFRFCSLLYRFGHSSNVALLASPSVEQQDDYKRGVQLFCSFLLMILFLWTVILIIFKIMGPTRVGCAAGGNVLDIPLLRQQYSRGERKEMEQRSWRLQTTFMSFAILLFVLVGLFLNKGLGSMGTSLSYVYDVSDVSDCMNEYLCVNTGGTFLLTLS